MTAPMDSESQRLIETLVQTRIASLRSGDQARLDSTYLERDLKRRTQHNCFEVDTYRQSIEHGFGAEVQQYQIRRFQPGIALPYGGLAYFDSPLDYIVYLKTVDGRETAWFVKIVSGEAKVQIPVFNGRVFSTLAMGMPRMPEVLDDEDACAVGFHFDEGPFVEELSRRIVLELGSVRSQLQFDTLHAIALDWYPQYGYLYLSLLTDKENEGVGKWQMDQWRYFDFTGSPCGSWPYAQDLIQQMKGYYDAPYHSLTEDQDEDEADDETAKRADEEFRACAKALTSKRVMETLAKSFHLVEDFEAAVFDPHNPTTDNYCWLILQD